MAVSALLLGLAVASASILYGDIPTVPGAAFVQALPFSAYFSVRESAAGTCTRAGYGALPFGGPLPLSASAMDPRQWNATLASSIVSSMAANLIASGDTNTTVSFGVLGQCCSNNLYATTSSSQNGSSSNITISSQGYGALSYSNTGWTAKDSDTPIYGCSTALSSSSPTVTQASLLRSLTRIPVAADAYPSKSTSGYSKTRITVDGRGFGNETYGLAVTAGGASCDNVDLCHSQCTRCSSNSDCSSGRVCVRWTSSGTSGFCLRYCDAGTNACSCGGQCYILSSTDPLSGAGSAKVCANRGLTAQSPSSAVCATGDWRPAANTTLDSRLECSLELFPPASKTIAMSSSRRRRRQLTGAPAAPKSHGAAKRLLSFSALSQLSLVDAATSTGTGTSSSKGRELGSGSGAMSVKEALERNMPGRWQMSPVEPLALTPAEGFHEADDEELSANPARLRPQQLNYRKRELYSLGAAATVRLQSPNLASYGPFAYRYGGVCSGSLPASTVSADPTDTDQTPSGLVPVIVILNGFASSGVDPDLLIQNGLSQYASGPQPPLPSWYISQTASNLNFSWVVLASGRGAAGVLGYNASSATAGANGTAGVDQYNGTYPTLPYSYPIPLLNLSQAANVGGKGRLFGGECAADSDCPILDSCTVPRCVLYPSAKVGCCQYSIDPSGACNSVDPPLQTSQNFISSSAYLPLPREVAGALPLPPPPAGLLNSSATDMSIKSRAMNPGFIQWDPRSLWYNYFASPFTGTNNQIVSTAFSTPYALSSASYQDDEPTEEVPLSFTFPFFGSSLKKVWISPNGFIRSLPEAPCGATYLGVGCSLMSSYVGVIGPIIADFSPKDYRFAEIYKGWWNLSSLIPLGSMPSLAAAGSLNPSSSAVFCASFMNMGLWKRIIDRQAPPNPGFASQVCIHGDGGIRMRYGSLLNVPAPDPLSWTASTTVGGWGGAPNTSEWLAGVRSPSGGLGLGGLSTDEALQALGGQSMYTYSPNSSQNPSSSLSPAAMAAASAQWAASPDLIVSSPTNLLFSRKGVKQATTSAMCALTPIACALSSTCGSMTGGGTLSLQWTMPGCGSGFDSLLFTRRTVTNTTVPRIECVFGSVAVPAQPVLFSGIGPSAGNPNNIQYSVNCVAPPAAAILAGSSSYASLSGASNLTVAVTLQLIAPADPASFVYNNNAANIVSTQAVSGAGSDPLAYSVLGTGPAATSVSSTTSTVTIPLPVYGVQSDYRSTANATFFRQEYLVPSPLLYTYTSGLGNSPQCGCSPSTTYGTSQGSCDVCGVCGGDGKTVDCAGVCFGTAYLDDCGVCSGGTTNSAPNKDKDCNGVCFGPGTDCGNGGDGGMTAAATALAIVLIISLVTCSIVVFSILAYCAWAGVQHRRAQLEAMLFFEANGGAEAEIPGPPAGLSEATMATMPCYIYGQEPPAAAPAAPSLVATDGASASGEKGKTVAAVANPMTTSPGSASSPKGTTASATTPTSAASSTPAAATTTNSSSSNDDSCAICLETFVVGQDEVRKMAACKHLFHKTCSDEWLSRSTVCPVCRADLRGPTELAEHEEYQRQLEELRAARRAAAATAALSASGTTGSTATNGSTIILIAGASQNGGSRGGRRRGGAGRRGNRAAAADGGSGGSTPSSGSGGGQIATSNGQSRSEEEDEAEEDEEDGEEEEDDEEEENEQQVRAHESRSTAVAASAVTAARGIPTAGTVGPSGGLRNPVAGQLPPPAATSTARSGRTPQLPPAPVAPPTSGFRRLFGLGGGASAAAGAAPPPAVRTLPQIPGGGRQQIVLSPPSFTGPSSSPSSSAASASTASSRQMAQVPLLSPAANRSPASIHGQSGGPMSPPSSMPLLTHQVLVGSNSNNSARNGGDSYDLSSGGSGGGVRQGGGARFSLPGAGRLSGSSAVLSSTPAFTTPGVGASPRGNGSGLVGFGPSPFPRAGPPGSTTNSGSVSGSEMEMTIMMPGSANSGRPSSASLSGTTARRSTGGANMPQQR